MCRANLTLIFALTIACLSSQNNSFIEFWGGGSVEFKGGDRIQSFTGSVRQTYFFRNDTQLVCSSKGDRGDFDSLLINGGKDNDKLIFSSHNRLSYFTLSDFSAEELFISYNNSFTSLNSAIVSSLTLWTPIDQSPDTVIHFSIKTSTVDVLKFDSQVFAGSLSFVNPLMSDNPETYVQVIYFDGCRIIKDLTFEGLLQPRYIIFESIHSIGTGCFIDLNGIRRFVGDTICRLYLGGLGDNLNKIKMNYENFGLEFGKNETNRKKENMYKELLQEQLNQGYIGGYEKLNKEFKAFEYLKDSTILGKAKNWLDSVWWDYGYDKFRVITNSMWIFLGTIILNLCIFPLLIRGYLPIKFKKVDARLVQKFNRTRSLKKYPILFIRRVPFIIIYTSYLFWGLRLDIKQIEIKQPLILGILIVEYLAGLVCLGYIANYVISK